MGREVVGLRLLDSLNSRDSFCDDSGSVSCCLSCWRNSFRSWKNSWNSIASLGDLKRMILSQDLAVRI